MSNGILLQALSKVDEELSRQQRVAAFRRDPVAWAEYMLGPETYIWSKQRDILDSVMVHKNTAVKAGHGVGKSYISALMVCHWIDVNYPNCFVATTAPSVSQISAILWREIKRLYSIIEKRYEEGLIDHKLPGKINSDTRNPQWQGDNGQLIGFGRKPPENKQDDAFQGIHDEYVLAVGDEAVGLPPELIDALGNITSNENSRRVLLCNPTNPASYVGKIYRENNEAWNKLTISVFDSPNFTDEKSKVPQHILDKLTGPEYVADKKKEYGENSARYKSRVLGEFAFDVGDSLIQPEDIAVALDTVIEPPEGTKGVLGVDVASYGDDSSVAYHNVAGRLRFAKSWDKATAQASARHIFDLAQELDVVEVRLDAGGFGGAVADLVAEKMANAGEPVKWTLIRMFGNGASPDKRQWFNARAHWWDTFRSNARQGLLDIDPEDENSERMQDELMSVEYKIGTTGGVQIESKLDMRKRGLKSPDFADAAIYASADMSWLIQDPLAGVENGEIVYADLDQFEEDWANVLAW